MRIGELSRRAGVSVRALRYYEEKGLLASERTSGGQREYREDAVGQVVFFQQMYAAGLSSRRIADLLPCMDTGMTTEEQREMLVNERARLDERVGALQTARDRLDEVIAAASGTAVVA